MKGTNCKFGFWTTANPHPFMWISADELLLGIVGKEDIFAPTAMSFNPYNLLAGLIFGTIGWGAFNYGRKLELWKPKAIGAALMMYAYFFSNAWLLWGIGIGLLVTLWYHHDE